MTATARGIVVALGLLVVAAGSGSPAEPPALRGACYCRVGTALDCTASLSERDCRRQCDEALCDDWFWKDRLPCWNWGYGG